MLFKDKKNLAIFFLVLSIILLLANSFRITNPEINNSDPTSYIIVPIVMLPLLAAFMYKTNPIPALKKGDIVAGVVCFAIFIALIIALELLLPYLFLSYRIDMLLLPIALASLIMLLFGVKNLKKFWPIIIYPIIASPLIFLPISGLNDAFAQANTIFVYGVLHLFSQGITYIAPFSISTSSYTIGIGTACAGISAFIALLLFLAPIAYLLDGDGKNKIYWLFSGFVLLIVLNLLRMAGIAAIWLVYGPNATVDFVHGFAGILLFYVSIVGMILVAKRYGLTFQKIKRQKAKKQQRQKFEWATALCAVVLSLGYVLISSNYLLQPIVPIQSGPMQYNFTSQSLVSFAGNFSHVHGWNFTVVWQKSTSAGILVISNGTFIPTSPLIMLFSGQNQSIRENLFVNSTIVGQYSFVDQRMIPTQIYKLISNNSVFYVSLKASPYIFPNNQYAIVQTYLIMPAAAGDLNLTCTGSYDTLYTLLDNTLLWQGANQTDMTQLASAYCVSSDFV